MFILNKPCCIGILIFLFSCNQRTEVSHPEPNASALPAASSEPVNQAASPGELNQLVKEYEKSMTQVFTVQTGKPTVIRGKNGLELTVNPTSLLKEDGAPVDGPITVKLIELTNTGDLYRCNATTVSNGELLVSGGSYFIGMECNGQSLKIKSGAGLSAKFPKIKNGDMELFYGNRDATGTMNWNRAEQNLSFFDMVKYGSYNPPYPFTGEKKFKSRYVMYESLSKKIFFEDHLMSIRRMVELLNKRGIDKHIDTVKLPVVVANPFPNAKEKFIYDTLLRYRVLTACEAAAEKDTMEKEALLEKQHLEANELYRAEYSRMNAFNSVPGQLQQYYAPESITSLGWINCDRFYNNPQNTDLPVELPYTFSNPQIQYFIIYKSFNGLMSGRLKMNNKGEYVLDRLPQGESVRLVAFAINNGAYYEYTEDFVISAGKKIKPAFRLISVEELRKKFGNNIKT